MMAAADIAYLSRPMPQVGGVVHTHSMHATAQSDIDSLYARYQDVSGQSGSDAS
jgi:hypothetical protein